jgi:hypothetical protein
MTYFEDRNAPPTQRSVFTFRSTLSPDDLTEIAAEKVSSIIKDRDLDVIKARIERQVRLIDDGTIIGGGIRILFLYKDADQKRAVFIVMENRLKK